MTDRNTLADAFLLRAGWGNALRRPLAGDASNRRYERLTGADGAPAVLMDAPPEKGEDVRPFLHIARHLAETGLSAPAILATDEDNGFLLLEDLGDDLFARVMPRQSDLEPQLYEAAAEALIRLHAVPPPKVSAYDAPLMTRMSALAYDWYLRGITGGAGPRDAFSADFEPMLAQLGAPEVLILRDYHAENLLWLPGRTGVARVGQLDFQDALLGHRAYDLVSLLQDARRDVAPEIEERILSHFIQASGADEQRFRAAYTLLGIQRNLRILGVFARLCLHWGKVHYVDFIPRVWGYLMRDLDAPGMAPLKARLLLDLPAPTAQTLQKLKDQCATYPLP